MIDRRYIYLMEKKKTPYALFTFQRLVKIGIATNPGRRLAQVNRALSGPVKLLLCQKVFFARRLEAFLHNLFNDSRTRLKRAGRGAGKTEWFYLNPAELLLLRLWIWLFSIIHFLIITTTVIICLLIIETSF